jgi:hypothetical protein
MKYTFTYCLIPLLLLLGCAENKDELVFYPYEEVDEPFLTERGYSYYEHMADGMKKQVGDTIFRYSFIGSGDFASERMCYIPVRKTENVVMSELTYATRIIGLCEEGFNGSYYGLHQNGKLFSFNMDSIDGESYICIGYRMPRLMSY